MSIVAKNRSAPGQEPGAGQRASSEERGHPDYSRLRRWAELEAEVLRPLGFSRTNPVRLQPAVCFDAWWSPHLLRSEARLPAPFAPLKEMLLEVAEEEHVTYHLKTLVEDLRYRPEWAVRYRLLSIRAVAPLLPGNLRGVLEVLELEPDAPETTSILQVADAIAALAENPRVLLLHPRGRKIAAGPLPSNFGYQLACCKGERMIARGAPKSFQRAVANLRALLEEALR